MSHVNRFFLTKEKLKQMIEDFETNPVISDGYELKGFVFTPGMEEVAKGLFKEGVYPFPIYSKNLKAGSDGDILIQNTDPRYMGCPYPPPCDTKDFKEDCYGLMKK